MKRQWVLLALVGILGVALVAAAITIRATVVDENAARIETLALEGEAAHDALCAFRAGLDRQIDSSKAYLADVQQGRRQRVPGITDNDIRASIRRQQTTIDSLSKSGLDCETKGAP